jgi:hypothetical protein
MALTLGGSRLDTRQLLAVDPDMAKMLTVVLLRKAILYNYIDDILVKAILLEYSL